MQNLRVAVDVGGTFTDICIMDETTGLIRIEKTASTPDPIDGIMARRRQGRRSISPRSRCSPTARRWRPMR